MVKESFTSAMGAGTKALSMQTALKDSEFMFGLTAKNMLESGHAIKCTEKEFLTSPMGENMKGTI